MDELGRPTRSNVALATVANRERQQKEAERREAAAKEAAAGSQQVTATTAGQTQTICH